jgi:hypothetical protein
MSRVFQNIDPRPPLRPASMSYPPPPPQQRRGYTLAGRRGGWGVNILETRDIGLASYRNNLSTAHRDHLTAFGQEAKRYGQRQHHTRPLSSYNQGGGCHGKGEGMEFSGLHTEPDGHSHLTISYTSQGFQTNFRIGYDE